MMRAIQKRDSQTTHLSVVELANLSEENYEDPNLYFGEEAKDNFWNLYKSERRFKDFDVENDEIQDPRFAYLKTCKDLKVFPKARMVIRDKKTTHLDYSNYQLLNKSAVAVGEAIKRYSLTIEEINLMNNGLKATETKILLESLQRHYSKLSVLNLSKNKIGSKGAKVLSEALR